MRGRRVAPSRMRPHSSKITSTRADLKFGAAVVVLGLVLVGLILLRSKRTHYVAAQRCPIDGMAAEWRSDRPGTNNICNYGHFSNVDQKANTWWAVCW